MFRREVLTCRSDRLSGNVSIAVPLSWQAIGYLIGGSVIAGISFLAFANYARIETVSGTIAPAAGVSTIIPMRSGVITALPAQDGQDVPAGAVLASIKAEEDSASGPTGAARIEAAIAQQDTELAMQSGAVAAAARAQLRQLAVQRAGLQAEAAQLQSQIHFQQSLIASAQRDYERTRPIAEQGFISIRDMQQREDTLLSRQQGLAQLTQALAAKQSAAAEAERNEAQVVSQSRAQSASLAASRASVAQQAASTNSTRAYVLRAPVAGRVTALTARVGQPVSTQASLMTILPAGSELRAELTVPSTAIAFVKPGQEVHLAVDAFPYQRFGTVIGKVLTVASNAVSRTDASGATVAVYPVTVALGQKAVQAYGRREPLVSGMTLTARIVTEKQSLFAWLFEPLYAVQRR